MNTSETSCSTVWNLTSFLFKTWHAKFWNATFLRFHAPKSWQFTIQDLAFQVLKHWGYSMEHVLAWDVLTIFDCLMCVAWEFEMSFHVISCNFMSFHDCLRSAPHATLAGRRLLHFIVWVFSLAFLMLMFMFNDCGPDSCDHKRHRECVAMAFQHHACWGQDLLWPELLQCGKKARESHLSTCVILANIHAGIQSRHQVVLHVKVFFPFISCLAEW